MSFEIHVQAKKTNKNAHVLSPPPAGRPQLGDLSQTSPLQLGLSVHILPSFPHGRIIVRWCVTAHD